MTKASGQLLIASGQLQKASGQLLKASGQLLAGNGLDRLSRELILVLLLFPSLHLLRLSVRTFELYSKQLKMASQYK